MVKMSLDQIFSTAVLNVLVPDTSLEFPPNTSVDKWLAAAQVTGVERRQAFYGQTRVQLPPFNSSTNLQMNNCNLSWCYVSTIQP